MDFDASWWLIALPLAFALGWLASRLDLRQWRRDSRDAPRAVFKGLNLLLNEQQDEAVDAFVQAVQNEPESAELHFALGNLFRRRGEFERAVRVHEHLLQRGDLRPAERQRAQRALAQDYMKAGLFDRAEQAWKSLLGTAFDREAELALLSLFERSRDWEQAAQVAERLQAGGAGAFGARIAHHWCELAEQADARGDTAAGDLALARARLAAPESPRPNVLAGQRHARAGRHELALEAWDPLRDAQPAAFLLVAEDYARSALACGRAAAAHDALSEQAARFSGVDLLNALALLEPGAAPEALVPRLAEHLRQHGGLSTAARLLAVPAACWPEGVQPELLRAVQHAAQPLQRYRCAACGFEAAHYFWQCPGCLSWDSYPAQHIEEL